MRRKGDVKAEKALLAEVYKLLGNSAYGKFIKAVERQTKVLYTKDEDVVRCLSTLTVCASPFRTTLWKQQ